MDSPAKIQFRCTHCGKALKAAAEPPGRPIRCPGCNGTLKVPGRAVADAPSPPPKGGPADDPAVAALIAELEKEPSASGRSGTCRKLAALGEAAIPALVRTLRHPRPEIAKDAASALAAIGKPALPALTRELAGPDLPVRLLAAEELASLACNLKGEAVGAVAALRAGLKDGNPSIRYWCAQALGYIGPPAQEAAADLRAILADPDTHVRKAAAKAVDAVVPGSNAGEELDREKIAGLIQKLQQAHSDTERAVAVSLLGDYREKALAAVPGLIGALRDPDAQVREYAAVALSKIGPPAREAVPALTEALKDPSRTFAVANCAARALRKIDPEAAARAGVGEEF